MQHHSFTDHTFPEVGKSGNIIFEKCKKVLEIRHVSAAQVPFMFKYAVDALTVDPSGAVLAATPFMHVWPATALLGYGAARIASSACNEARNAVFAKVRALWPLCNGSAVAVWRAVSCCFCFCAAFALSHVSCSCTPQQEGWNVGRNEMQKMAGAEVCADDKCRVAPSSTRRCSNSGGLQCFRGTVQLGI
jgi:hypothetical protein